LSIFKIYVLPSNDEEGHYLPDRGPSFRMHKPVRETGRISFLRGRTENSRSPIGRKWLRQDTFLSHKPQFSV
jgi:hypothetical protein